MKNHLLCFSMQILRVQVQMHANYIASMKSVVLHMKQGQRSIFVVFFAGVGGSRSGGGSFGIFTNANENFLILV